METRAHNVAVGAFVLTIVFLALVAVLWLGRVAFSQEYANYDIYFTGPVTGLTQGAPVQYNGIRVGRVADIRLDPENVEQIRVEVEIDTTVVIKANAVAGLETNLLSGVSFIQIRGGTREAPVLVEQKGQRYPVIASERSSLERLYARAPQLLAHLIEVADNINLLLGPHNQKAFTDSLDNVQALTSGLAGHSKELGETVVNADAALAELATLLHNVNDSYVGHDGLKEQLTQLIGDYDRLAKGLNDSNRQLQLVMQDARPGVREFSQHTLGQLGDLVGDARQMIAGITRLAAEIERDPTRFLFGDRREGYRPR